MTDVFDDLDRLTLEVAGDPITYTQGGIPLSIKAWIDHSPDVIDFGVASGVTAEASAQIRKIDVATPVRATDRIDLPRTGKRYRIASEPLHSRCGRLWNLLLVTSVD